MLTRDFYLSFLNKDASIEKQVGVGKFLVIILALVGLLIAYQKPATIFDIATNAFTGLALLFPATLAVLYWRRTAASSCIVSIVVGELLLICLHLQIIPASFTMGFLPVVPLILITSLIIVIGSLLSNSLNETSV